MEKRIRFSSTQTQASSDWIPWDLWLQILCFLPVRSLVVFRSVCRSFLSIIDDPDFVSLHLRRFPGNALETRFLTHKIDSSEIVYELREINNSVSSSSSTWNTKIIDRIMKPGFPTMITPAWVPFHWHLKCSLNGLLLLSYSHSSIFNTSVALWNPSIKKHRQLSLPLQESHFLQYGLGYHPSSYDYKLVAFDKRQDQGWVYSVKTDAWAEILDSRFRDKLDGDNYYLYSRSLSLKNFVFWIEYYGFRTLWVAEKLLWFDFETERFGYAEMPYSADRRTHQELMKLDGGSSMGVWRVDEEERVFVCALETDAMSWTLRYKLAPPHGLQRSISGYRVTFDSRLEERNGELVWKFWEASCDKDLIIVSYDDIDIKTQMYRRKFIERIQKCLDIYVESLVMLN